MADYSATKINAPFPDSAAYDPNAEIFKADNTWEWSGKFSGTYLFRYGLTVSAFFDHRSGTPGARQVLFTGDEQIPSLLVNVEPVGTLRLPNSNTLDLRVEKPFRPAKGVNWSSARRMTLDAEAFSHGTSTCG